MADWYYADNDQQRGPVTREKLVSMIAAGQVLPSDLVWTDGMANWASAAQVRGLVPAGMAGPSQAGRAAGEEKRAKSHGLWADLSPGTKIGILTGTGGGLVVILLAIIITVVGQTEQIPLDQVIVAPAAGTPASAAAGRAHKPAKSADEQLVIYDFDPKSITTLKQKDAYELGCKQGREMAEEEVQHMAEDATKEQLLHSTATFLRQRDIAIYEAVKLEGADSIAAMKAFGWRDGMRAWLKDHKLPMPAK